MFIFFKVSAYIMFFSNYTKRNHIFFPESYWYRNKSFGFRYVTHHWRNLLKCTWMSKEENQLDVTEWFIALVICSTCFGHL